MVRSIKPESAFCAFPNVSTETLYVPAQNYNSQDFPEEDAKLLPLSSGLTL